MSTTPEPAEVALTPVPPVPPAPPAPPAPEPRRGCLGRAAAAVGVLASLIYILNPGLGIFELLPDNLPGIGNLDEAGAAALLIFGLRFLFKKPPASP